VYASPVLLSCPCLSGIEQKTPSNEPRTANLQTLNLDEDSRMTMENIVDDTLNLHSASDVRVLYSLCLSLSHK
jgi:hypothetical protein